ncbi:MAG: threonine synthase [Verrucomicrobia bacterium]|jgi:threonine synthase|nr:threonine synthase [Verrucomicrobiota bacterium]
MRYVSTRGNGGLLGFCEAVETGLAPDGGLYVPEKLPSLKPLLEGDKAPAYPELCKAFFRLFATDIDPAVLDDCIDRAYARFDDPAIAPLRRLREDLFVLELFHGPTLAFKDFALQLLGNLYEAQIRRTGRPITVLGATSGDTGAAAIHGLLGRENVHTFILYPANGVSPLQERQMTCTGADNVFALAIKGTFDDAQSALKEVFGDPGFRAETGLSAVNSINLARVLAQCVYYLHAWWQLPPAARENLCYVVPTGNFGNILAGWWCEKMGLPEATFRIATNRNDILYRLFTTGRYELARVAPSTAPSMDIQVASNFERFLYYHEGGDPDRVRSIMSRFREDGRYHFEQFDRDRFSASRADDERIRHHIREVYREFGYLPDPHTACAFEDLPGEGTKVVLATAHPAKFPTVIEEAVGIHPTAPALEALKARQPRSFPLEPDPAAIKDFIRNHRTDSPS